MCGRWVENPAFCRTLQVMLTLLNFPRVLEMKIRILFQDFEQPLSLMSQQRWKLLSQNIQPFPMSSSEGHGSGNN